MPDYTPKSRRNSRHDRRPDPYDSDSDFDEHDRRRARSSSYDSFRRGDHSSRSAHKKRSHSADRYHPSASAHRHHHHRSRRGSPYPYREQERIEREKTESRSNKKLEYAMIAAIDAAAVETYRLRHEPGEWVGAKGARVATAAIGAAAMDMAIDKNPGRHSKRTLLESTIGGLVANRLANGPRDELRRRSH